MSPEAGLNSECDSNNSTPLRKKERKQAEVDKRLHMKIALKKGTFHDLFEVELPGGKEEDRDENGIRKQKQIERGRRHRGR